MNVIRNEKVPEPPRNRPGRLNLGRLRGRGALPLSTRNFNIPQRHQWNLGARNRQQIGSSSSNLISTTTVTPITTQSRKKSSTSTSSALPSSSRARTPGSRGLSTKVSGGSSSTNDTPSIILALTAGRGDARTEIGMAAIDLQYPHMILCQISDCQTYMNALTKIYYFDPLVVLMPETMCNSRVGKGQLYQSIEKKFPGLNVTPISRAHFNDFVGLDRVKTLCAQEYSSVELFIKEKYYALAAAAALLKYVEYMQQIIYAPKSLKIEFQGSPYASVIDMDSAESLELVSSQSGHRNFTLLGVLDRCSTPMGRRLLRASILQPYYDEEVILQRQSCVAELVTNRSLSAIIQPIVRRLYGADRLLSMSMQSFEENRNSVKSAEQNLNFILLLKNSLDILPELRSVLQNGESVFFKKFYESLENPEFRIMKDKILRVVHPDARSVLGYTSSNIQRCFAIKAGLNDLLDIARQTYCELIDDMKIMVENLASQYKLPLSLACTSALGYHIQAVFSSKSSITTTDFPEEFIEVKKNRNTFTMTTKRLLVSSQQCRIASEELHVMSNILLCELLKSVRNHVCCLFQLTADLAELDVIISLAQVSSHPEYVRPKFDNKLELENSVHPSMAAFGIDHPVPNSVNASLPYNFHVITGPNMSGKSTYLKQIVLLQIMAQIGCYVPATKATVRIADRIFCRISFHDDIDSNSSTFTVEIKEAQYILQWITPKSLVILDELCRGTTVEEGSSIAWGIYERLLMTSAFTFAATHFSYLTKLSDIYYNVTNHYFEAVPVTRRGTSEQILTYTHSLKRGTAPANEYGITLAEMSGLCKSITEQARKIASQEQQGKMISDVTVDEDLLWDKKCYDLVAQIYLLIETENFSREHIQQLLMQSEVYKELSSRIECERLCNTDQNVDNSSSRKTLCNQDVDISVNSGNSSMTSGNPSVSNNLKHTMSMESYHTQKLRILHTEPSSDKTNEDASSSNMQTIPVPPGIKCVSFSSVSSSGLQSEKKDTTESASNSQPNFTDITNQECSSANQSQSASKINFTFELTNEEQVPELSLVDIENLSLCFTPKITSTPELFEYCPLDLSFCPPSLSNVSVLTADAQESVRAKEAEIFKQIEGQSYKDSSIIKSQSIPVSTSLTHASSTKETPTNTFRFPFF